MGWSVSLQQGLSDRLAEEVKDILASRMPLNESTLRLLTYRLQNTITLLQLSAVLPEKLNHLQQLMRALYSIDSRKIGKPSLTHPNAAQIAKAGREFLSSSKDINASMKCLQSRRNLDPQDIATRLPLTLVLRLQANQISLDDYYILINEPLLSDKPKRPPPWFMPLHEALQIITDTLSTFQAERIWAMYRQNRIRLLSVSDPVGNCCVIVENDAFIQIVENKAGVNVLSLVHELGHALQLEGMLAKQHVGLTTLSKEVAAITMETAFLYKLTDLFPQRSGWARNYQNYLRYWYLDWHRRVHEFELNLYQLSELHDQTLYDVWQRYLQAPPEWQKIQHLYTSPFTCILYAFAYKMVKIIPDNKNIKQ